MIDVVIHLRVVPMTVARRPGTPSASEENPAVISFTYQNHQRQGMSEVLSQPPRPCTSRPNRQDITALVKSSREYITSYLPVCLHPLQLPVLSTGSLNWWTQELTQIDSGWRPTFGPALVT